MRDSQQPASPIVYRFPMFETSATALCGTTGNYNYDQGWKFEESRYEGVKMLLESLGNLGRFQLWIERFPRILLVTWPA